MPKDKKKKKKNIMKDLTINEVSFCGRGMNPGAHVTLFKSVDRALVKTTFEEVLAGMEMSEAVYEIISHAYDMSHALEVSLTSIIYDDDITDKKAAVKESLLSFIEHLEMMAENAEVMKAVDPKQWISDHPDEDLDELISLITKTLSKEEDMSDELKKKLKKAEEKNKALEADLAKANKLALLTDDQKKYYKGLDEGERDAWLEKSDDEKNADITKSREGDEEITVAGIPVRKSEVGATSFAIFKAQDEEIKKEREKNAKAEEIRKAQEFQTRAETDYPNIPGDKVVKGKLMAAIAGMDEADAKAAHEMLKASNEALGKSFDEHGHGHRQEGNDAEEKLNNLAKAYATEHSVTHAVAYDAVMKTAEGQALYDESIKQKPAQTRH